MNYEKIANYLNYLIGLLSSYLVKASGFWGFLLNIAIKYLKKAVSKLGKYLNIHKEENKELKQYEETIAKPDLSREDRRLADKSFLGDD